MKTSFYLFAALTAFASLASAQEPVYLDENLTGSVSFTSSESGGLATLGGAGRTLVEVGVALDRQVADNTGTIDVLFNLYDVGIDNDPETLLFTTTFDDFVLPADVEFWLDVTLPNLVVPDQIAWTTRISDITSPSSVGRSVSSGPEIGSFDGGRFSSNPSSGIWTNLTSSTGFRAFAVSVPEPSSAVLLFGVSIFIKCRRVRLK